MVGETECLGARLFRHASHVTGSRMSPSSRHFLVFLVRVLTIHDEEVGASEMRSEAHGQTILVLVVGYENENLAGGLLLEAVANGVLGVVALVHPDDKALPQRELLLLERHLPAVIGKTLVLFHCHPAHAAPRMEEKNVARRELDVVAVDVARPLAEVHRKYRRPHDEVSVNPPGAEPMLVGTHDAQERVLHVGKCRKSESLSVVMMPVRLKDRGRLAAVLGEVPGKRHDACAGVNYKPMPVGQTIRFHPEAGGVAAVLLGIPVGYGRAASGAVESDFHLCPLSRCCVFRVVNVLLFLIPSYARKLSRSIDFVEIFDKILQFSLK